MLRPLRTVLLALAVVALALLAVGCGEDPHVKYQRQLGEVGDRVAASLAKVPSSGDQPIQPKQIAGLARSLRDSAGDVDGIDAPTAATKRAQKTFARGLRGVASALAGLSRDLARSPDEAQQAERFVQFATDDKIQRSFDDLETAEDAYARAGYRVFKDPNEVAAPAAAKVKSKSKSATSAKR